MSIIQEALKKAQLDYLKKNTHGVKSAPGIKLSPQLNIAMPKAAARVNIIEARKTRTPMTMWLIFILGAVIMLALVLRVSLMFSLKEVENKKSIEGPLMSKEGRFASLAEMTAPASFVKPPPPKELVIPALPPSPSPVFILNGVMNLGAKPQAIINGYILEEGDTINDATIVEISENYVLLNLKDEKIKLHLKN